jgi:hypothetical protein
VWTLAVTGILALIAWLYQRAWERQRLREDAYGRILDTLPALFEGQEDPALVETLTREMRRLILFAPDSVIQRADEFLIAMKVSPLPEREGALNGLVMAMRQDCTYSAVLLPGFWRSRLTSSKLVLWTASRPKS